MECLDQQTRLQDCENVLRISERFVKEQESALKAAERVISTMSEDNSNLEKLLAEAKAEREAWYNKPMNVFLLGIFGGMLLQQGM